MDSLKYLYSLATHACWLLGHAMEQKCDEDSASCDYRPKAWGHWYSFKQLGFNHFAPTRFPGSKSNPFIPSVQVPTDVSLLPYYKKLASHAVWILCTFEILHIGQLVSTPSYDMEDETYTDKDLVRKLRHYEWLRRKALKAYIEAGGKYYRHHVHRLFENEP